MDRGIFPAVFPQEFSIITKRVLVKSIPLARKLLMGNVSPEIICIISFSSYN
jgi:hypothetical protein